MDILKIIWPLLVLVAVVTVLKLIFEKPSAKSKEKEKAEYHYKKQNFFMTLHENKFYQTLVEAVGHDYYIFAQVHLSTIVDHKIERQNWKGALSHIDRKSVDFVLCDKQYISPKLAIELDGRSHERSDRIERDGEVERILQEVGLPLLRIESRGNFDKEFIKNEIGKKLGRSSYSKTSEDTVKN